MTEIRERGTGKTGRVLYRVMLALWVGGISMYTFLVTPLIFISFERDMASSIVDKLFPFYFPYNLIVVILAFGSYLISGPRRKTGHTLTFALLVAALVIGLFVNYGLYPEAKRAKQEIASFEKSPADAPAKKRFRMLHGISMTLNLLLFADGVALIVIDSYRKNSPRIF